MAIIYKPIAFLNLKLLTVHQKTFFFLMLIITACDYNILKFDFLIGWDDHWVAINSYTEQGYTQQNLIAILFDFYRGQYAPVNQLYYTSLHSFFGYNPFYFHLAGVIVHILNSYLVYLLVQKILQYTPTPTKNLSHIPILTSVIFAIHPVNLEATAWIAASKILLYAFFYLLALHTYIAYLQSKKIRHYLLLLLFFILSFGAKEQAVTLPLCLLLFDYLAGRNLFERQVLIEKLPFIVLSSIFGVLTIASQQLGPSTTFHYSYSLIEKVLLACYSLTEYFTKCIIPVNLSYLYPFPFEPGANIPWWLYLYPALLLLLGLWIWNIRNQKWLITALLFFVIHIGVALNLLSTSRYAVVADRYVYVSSIGICFFTACVFTQISNLVRNSNKILFLTGAYVVILGIYTNRHSLVWKDSMILRQQFRKDIINRADYKKTLKKISNEDN